MQHPVGYRVVGNKAELTDFWAVLRNSTLWAEFSLTVLAAFVTGAMFVLGVSGWQLLRGRNVDAFTRSAQLAAGVALVCTVLVMVTGGIQAPLMDTQQPMKMAAAEAVYRTQAGASFSLASGYWSGTSTLIASPSGSGKTLMGLHFIFQGAHRGEPGVLASLQEKHHPASGQPRTAEVGGDDSRGSRRWRCWLGGGPTPSSNERKLPPGPAVRSDRRHPLRQGSDGFHRPAGATKVAGQAYACKLWSGQLRGYSSGKTRANLSSPDGQGAATRVPGLRPERMAPAGQFGSGAWRLPSGWVADDFSERCADLLAGS